MKKFTAFHEQGILRFTAILVLLTLFLNFLPSGFSQSVAQKEEDPNQCIKKIRYELYKPLPMPEITTPVTPGTDPGPMVSYDAKTKKQTILPRNPELWAKVKDFMKGSPGADSGKINPETVNPADNFSDLTMIGDPSLFPWRMNCKLFITFTDGSGGLHYGQASGALIDNRHVLTAGHVVWDNQYNWGWATEIIVVPGYENGNEPYGNSYMGNMLSWVAWTVSEDYNHDMGIISLDRPVGVLTGYFGYGYNNDDSFFTSTTFNNAQYPAESPYTGEEMYYWYGPYDVVTSTLCYYNQYSIKGQSGSGAYVVSDGNRQCYAEQSHRQQVGKYWRSGQVRITGSKFSEIGTYIANQTPDSYDLVPLDVNIEPATIATGETVSLFNLLVYNNSDVEWTGTVTYRVYLSTNDIISAGDIYLSEQYVNWTFPAKGTVRINGVLVDIPWTVPAGDYYVGAILQNSDANNGNNSTQGWDAAPIHINEGSLPAPASLTASKGDYSSLVYVDWPTVSGATKYRVYRGTVANSALATAVTTWQTSSYYYDYSASQGIRYYYWVKAAADVNGYSASPFSTYDYGYRDGTLNCAAPVNLFCGASHSGNNGSGDYNIAEYSLVSWNESGPEVVHQIEVYNTGTLTATLSDLTGDLDVFILGSCNEYDCLAYGDNITAYTVTVPGTYYIVVDGYGSNIADYTLTVSCPPPPVNRTIQNYSLYAGQSWCYDATDQIWIAGGATVFKVFNGASADLIAGTAIHLYRGTSVDPGGYLHAQISDQYCGFYHPPTFVASEATGEEYATEEPSQAFKSSAEPVASTLHFRVYPNPTSGKFRIECRNSGDGSELRFQVLTLLGKLVASPAATGLKTTEVDISDQNPGIYVIRMINGDKSEYLKVVKY